MFTDLTDIDVVLRGFLLTTCAMAWVSILVRVNGLRSFSKMTNFDFVMTVAMGSLLAGSSQSARWSEFTQSMIAMATLFAFQFSAAYLRRKSNTFESLIQNDQVILMRDGKVFEDSLASCRVTRDDLTAKL